MLTGVTKALHNQSIAALEGDCTEKLTHIVDLVRGDLTNLQRITLGKSQSVTQIDCLHFPPENCGPFQAYSPKSFLPRPVLLS